MAKKKVAKKKSISAGKVAAIGAGVVAVGAGAYYLLGPKAKEHQKKLADWTKKMKKEAEAKVKKIKDVTGPAYENVVDTIATTYAKKYKTYSKDIENLAKNLKKEWKSVKKQVKPAVKKAKKAVKKKVTKKA